MGLRKEFSGVAPPTTLAGTIDDSTLSFSLTSGSGYPTGTYPFVLAIGAEGTAGYEKVLCASRSGTNITATSRGYDGTSAQAHTAGDPVEHVLDAVTLTEANRHANDGDAVAHAAANITYAGGTGMAATTVEGALDELATEKISAPASPSDDDVLTYSGGSWTAAAPAASGGLLAVKVHDPGLTDTNTTSSTSTSDVDSTNLVVTFAAPASGSVLVRLTAYAGGTVAVGAAALWGLRSGVSDVVAPKRVMATADWAGPMRISAVLYVSGLTPGTSYTYKWSYASATTDAIYVYAGSTLGPAVMEVVAVPA